MISHQNRWDGKQSITDDPPQASDNILRLYKINKNASLRDFTFFFFSFCFVTALFGNNECEKILAEIAEPLFPGTNVSVFRHNGRVFKVYGRFGERAPEIIDNVLRLATDLEKKLPGDVVKALGRADYVESGKKTPALLMEDLQAQGMDDIKYFVHGKKIVEVESLLISMRELIVRLAKEKVLLLDHEKASNFMTNGTQIKVIDLEAITLDPKSQVATQKLKLFKEGVIDPDGAGFSEVLCKYYYNLYQSGHVEIAFQSAAWGKGPFPSPITYEAFRKLIN